MAWRSESWPCLLLPRAGPESLSLGARALRPRRRTRRPSGGRAAAPASGAGGRARGTLRRGGCQGACQGKSHLARGHSRLDTYG